MPSPFDPLAWLAGKSTTAYLDDAGQVRLRFNRGVRFEDRARIQRVVERHYVGLLRLQLDVPDGTRPRTVQQLMAAGKIKIGKDGRYVLVG